jgi:hypothetical protein
MFLSMGHYKFVNLYVRYYTVSNKQKELYKTCRVDTVWCLTDKFMNL